MNRKLISLLLAFTLVTALLAPCRTQAYAEGETYTYHGTYSGVSTWSPTDWEISSEYDMLGYTVTPFYGFWMNETKDGYDIVPELAAEFPVDVTAAYAGNAVYGVPADATEGYAWQVKMRDNATWEDGTPITARDVEYTLQQFLSPDMKNYRASLFYQGGTALANAESYYNSDKAGGIIKSAYGTGVDKFSSYGPYKLTGYQESKQIVFARNEGWFGYADERYEGMYQTTGIELSQIDEHTTQLTMFLQGNLDAVGLAADDMEKYGTSDYVYYTPTSNTYYLALNTDFDILKSRETEGVNKTILTCIDFRKAMSLSFDRTDYVMSCTSCSDPTFGLLNGMYVCDPVSGLAYRDSEYAQRALCEVYGVDSVDDLTGYNRDEATRLLQSAYDQCLADGNISDTDVVEIEYHVYSTDSANQKMVDYIEDAMLAAAQGRRRRSRSGGKGAPESLCRGAAGADSRRPPGSQALREALPEAAAEGNQRAIRRKGKNGLPRRTGGAFRPAPRQAEGGGRRKHRHQNPDDLSGPHRLP